MPRLPPTKTGERQMLIPKLTIEWVDSGTPNKSASIHCENARVIKKVNAYLHFLHHRACRGGRATGRHKGTRGNRNWPNIL